MKAKIFIIFLSLMVVSCGAGDKQARLEKLRKEHDEISEKIKKLEDEIKAGKKDLIDSNSLIQVGITEIKPQVFNHFIEVQGKLDGDENVSVSPKMGGVVTSKYADVGALVHKNQVLAQLDDAAFQTQVKELKTSLDFATDNYNKQKTLWDQKIGSEMQYLQAKNAKEALEKKLASLNEQIDMLKIKSPINGTIAEAGIRVGQMVSPGMSIVYRIVNFSSLKVVAEVAEAYASKINNGDVVAVNFPDINYTINAKVTFASEYINPINRTFTIEIHFASIDKQLKANMIAVIKINDYHATDAIVLPVNVVITENGKSYVFAAEKLNNQWITKKHYIQLGQTYNGLAEVTNGLKAGDKIISVGYQKVEEGKEIKF
jgi:membrane fusion protein, multidrug efflux system